ncbi:hypothetical protein KSP39_PZI001463 [Platanthera zijinensis]|uniref:Protein NUCLEAR FUSION DEFECTIVE 6, chloroplastic/mitochondrial-like n=1 Tax=Platanthera zijinensis TaxID=2320716 RepID=A0AAP0C1N7_9ASPA
MAAATAFRSVFRSSSARNVSMRFPGKNCTSRSPLRPPKFSSASPRFLRRSSATCFCLDSLLPMHTATSSALMISLLSVSVRHGYLSEGITVHIQMPFSGGHFRV